MILLMLLIFMSNAYASLGGISFMPGDQAMMNKQSVINLVAYVGDIHNELTQYEADKESFAVLNIVENELANFLRYAIKDSPQYILSLMRLRKDLDDFYAIICMRYDGIHNKIFVENVGNNYLASTYEIGSLKDSAMNVGSSMRCSSTPVRIK